MPEFPLPPMLRSMVDQDDARNRDLLTAALARYREHAEEAHGGDATPCGRAMVMCQHIGITDPSQRLTVHETHSLLAFAIERLYLLEVGA
jgi:hypothetical protein